MSNKEELIKIKIVGMFHDPPWKPWVIAGEILRKYRFQCGNYETIDVYDIPLKVKTKERPSHENQGLSVAMRIIMGKINGSDQAKLNEAKEVIQKYMDNYVKECDNLSSALDRYLNILNIQDKRVIPQKEKVNFVNPKLKYTLEVRPTIDGIDNFVCEIVEVSDKLRDKDLTLLYNYLYGNIELIWYKYNPHALPLADTRVKTFSVFDHLYSTVSFLNWYNEKEKAFEGYLVKIDIPGVQDIISRSRKIYDIWGGSWLVSALIFFTILPFIDEYGADVVLSPFMGLNPFFHTYLRSKLKILGLDRDIKDYMEDYDAIQPVMPATAFLALPKELFKDKDDINEKIREYYLNAWETIVDAVLNSGEVDKKIKIDEKARNELGTKNELKIRDELEKIKPYPIIPIRVSIKKANLKINDYGLQQQLELVKGFDKLFREDFEEPEIKFSYGMPSYPLINELTTALYKEKKLYKQCTNCGILPAFIWKEKCGKTKAFVFDEKNKTVIEGEVEEGDEDLEEGEALCYYCYLRRKLHYAKFDGVKKDSSPTQKIPFELNLREKLGSIPSTIDLANLDKWKKIMKCIKDNNIRGKGKGTRLPKPLEEFEECEGCREAWYQYAIKERFFVDMVENRELKVNENFNKCFDEIKGENSYNLYYAIVIGDGDFVGKRLWKGIIGMDFKNYIEQTREVLDKNKSIFEKNLEDFKEKFKEYLNVVYKCSPNSNNEYCRGNIIERTIPITPDYLIAVSRSLMLVALKDMGIISKYGVLVYAGGDDVVFLSPLKIPVSDPITKKEIKNTALGLVKLSRRNYWGALPNEEQIPQLGFLKRIKGFTDFMHGIFDLPAVYGRSYSILIAHYKDPFFALWSFVRELEKTKEYIEIGNGGEEKKDFIEEKKDFTFVLRGRGTLRIEDAAILENKAETFEALEVLYNKIGKELSISFVRDYLSAYKEFISSYNNKFSVNSYDKYNEYLNKLLDYVIERNKKVSDDKIFKDLNSLRNLKSEREICEKLRVKYDPRVEIVKAYDYLEV